jgi:hypothetical protein
VQAQQRHKNQATFKTVPEYLGFLGEVFVQDAMVLHEEYGDVPAYKRLRAHDEFFDLERLYKSYHAAWEVRTGLASKTHRICTNNSTEQHNFDTG